MTKRKPISIEQFESDCLKVIEHYQSDLALDLLIIHTKRPAIFFAYEMGSHAITLPPFESYPPHGEKVPYLFGAKDRDGILADTGCTLDSHSVKLSKLVHYFNGETITRIDHTKAAQIIDDYKRSMAAQFAKHNGLKATHAA